MRHTAKTRGPISIATSFAYLVPAFLLFPHHKPAAAAFALLTLGTLLFHATDSDYGLDAAGMIAATCTLIALPFGWIPEAIALAGGLVIGKVYYNHTLVASLILPVCVITLERGYYTATASALAIFTVGFLIWRRPGDWPHAAWHMATATGMTIVAVVLT